MLAIVKNVNGKTLTLKFGAYYGFIEAEVIGRRVMSYVILDKRTNKPFTDPYHHNFINVRIRAVFKWKKLEFQPTEE
tara:strand:- start:821 stop:1051 length:231 start_codon:yes stop_codon:yes gene_type:complete